LVSPSTTPALSPKLSTTGIRRLIQAVSRVRRNKAPQDFGTRNSLPQSRPCLLHSHLSYDMSSTFISSFVPSCVEPRYMLMPPSISLSFSIFPPRHSMSVSQTVSQSGFPPSEATTLLAHSHTVSHTPLPHFHTNTHAHTFRDTHTNTHTHTHTNTHTHTHTAEGDSRVSRLARQAPRGAPALEFVRCPSVLVARPCTLLPSSFVLCPSSDLDDLQVNAPPPLSLPPSLPPSLLPPRATQNYHIS